MLALPPVLRPANNADGPAVKQLIFRILTDYNLPPDPNGTDADLADLAGSYAERGGSFHVLQTAEGEIIGTVGIYRASADVCELRKMYLSRQHRGQGLGKRLLEHGLAEARRLGFRRVTLETASVLKEAIGLYLRYGFRPYTPEHLVPRCDQAYFLDLE